MKRMTLLLTMILILAMGMGSGWAKTLRRSIEWIIMRLIKVGARIVYHARRWYVHVASAFPLAHNYRAVLSWRH